MPGTRRDARLRPVVCSHRRPPGAAVQIHRGFAMCRRPVASLLVAAGVALSAAACSATTGLVPGHTAARARWARVAPASYTLTIFRSCECLPEMSGPVVVAVRNGIVESRHYLRSGAAVTPEYAALFPTVEGLFALVDAAVRDGISPLEVHYDEAIGFPAYIALGDPATDAPVYRVGAFRPR